MNVNQRAESFLKDYIDRVKPLAEEFFAEQKEAARKISPLAAEMVETFHNFLGGKRLRGALTYLAYQMFGGKSLKDSLKASLTVEIIHGFGLMHDDIIDEDHLRRGRPTVHKQYEQIFRQRFPQNRKKSAAHFGQSLALNVGDLGSFFVNLIIGETSFPEKTKLKFLKLLSQTIVKTLYGQGLDVFFENDEFPSQDKVLQVHRVKTAFYTINGPLKYGAILAGVREKSSVYGAIDQFATPVGIAFQLRDDELGTFSDEKTLGKPVDSDLKEGKNTLLFVKALERGSTEQIEFIKYAHGNKKVSKKESLKVRQIIKETGALKYSQEESRRLVDAGKRFIPQITADTHYQEMLRLVADYVIERRS